MRVVFTDPRPIASITAITMLSTGRQRGPQGFAELLKALQNANDPSHEEVCAWLGDFVPESFSADETNGRLRRRRKHLARHFTYIAPEDGRGPISGAQCRR